MKKMFTLQTKAILALIGIFNFSSKTLYSQDFDKKYRFDYFNHKRIYSIKDSIEIAKLPLKVKVLEFSGLNDNNRGISMNFISNLFNNISRYKNLEVIELDECVLNIKTSKLNTLSKLKYFHISNSKIDLPNIENRNIESIVIQKSNVNLNNIIWGKLNKLKYLYLSDFNDNDSSFSMIFKCKNLEVLNLPSNHLSSISPINLNFKKLVYLNLYDNNINIFPSWITSLSNLRKLYVNKNPIATLPNDLSNLAKLNLLNIGETEIVTIPLSLFKIKKLLLCISGGCNATVPSFSYSDLVILFNAKPIGWKINVLYK